MKRKAVWLVVSCLMVAALMLASCGPAEEEEEEVVTPLEEEEVTPSEEEEIVPPVKEMVKVTLEKLDGTTVELLKEKPKYGGEIVMTRSSPITGFDQGFTPHYQTTTMFFTNEELTTGDWAKGPAGTDEIGYVGNLDYIYESEVGCLAESWEIIDNKTVRYKIRQGIHWALDPDSEASRLVGGREMTAEDVAYSLRRHFLEPGCYMQSAHTGSQQEGWDAWVEDDWTVVHQWNPELARVILEYSGVCRVIAKEVIEKYGDMKDWRVNVGTGPFLLVDHIEGSSTTLVRNPDYWRKHPIYGEQMPYAGTLKILVIPDASTRLSALRTGKVDVLGAGWEDAEDLMENVPELEYRRNLNAGAPISLRMDNPDLPWNDIRVRYALAMAINNQEIADELYGGHAEILAHPILPYPEFMDMFTPLEEQNKTVQELFEYYPDKAKQLLAEAGYPEGFSAKVLCAATGVDTLSVIKGYWEQIGVDLQIDVRESTVFVGMYVRKKQEEMIYGTPGSGANNPSKFSNYYGVGHLNFTRIDDPRLNETMAAVDTMGWEFYTNRAKYAAIMKEIYPYILEQGWQIPLPGTYSYLFRWPWVKDYGAQYVGYIDLGNWPIYIWIDQDLKEAMGY